MTLAVIFDMDGLIIDSEPLQNNAWVDILKRHGKSPVLNEKTGLVHIIGISITKNWEYLKDKYGLSESVKELEEERMPVYLKSLGPGLKAMEGFAELVEKLFKNKIPMAIASSSKRNYIEIALKSLSAEKYFPVIISAAEFERGKPNPDVYLAAAKELGVKPESCVVLEDSGLGVQAGKNAGMKVITVPNSYTEDDSGLSLADVRVKSLKGVSLDMIKSL